MVWFDKENLCLYYVEFSDLENIKEFHVGSDIAMVDIIDNIIVCITTVDFIIILFSRVKKHKKWHIRLVNEPEHENGELFAVNSCILDNLITISFFELIQQEDREDEENEPNGDFKIIVWDLSYLIEALGNEDLDEDNIYDIQIGHIIIPLNFSPTVIHNSAYMKLNEETGALEKNYYILASSADDSIITVFLYDAALKMNEIRNFTYELEDDKLLWASIHSDGTIIAIGKNEIEMFSVDDMNLESRRKIPANIFENNNLYDIVSI